MNESMVIKESAGGIVHNNGKFLVINVIAHNEIILPKGTIESGETAEQAAVREVAEETGYKTKITTKLGDISYELDEDDGKRYCKTVHHCLLELIDEAAEPEPDYQEGEDFESIWLTADEAMARLTYDDSKRMLHKAVELLGGGRSI